MPDNKPQWTPGPWEWENDQGVYRLRAVAFIETGLGPIFDGQDPILDDGSAGGEYEQVIDPASPNAVLIAAAPDLYKALEMLMPDAEAYWIKTLAGSPAALQMAKAALLKANPQRQEVENAG